MRPNSASPFAVERHAVDWRDYDASSPRAADHDMSDEGVRLALMYRGRGEARLRASTLQRTLDVQERRMAREQSGMIANRAAPGGGLTTAPKVKAARPGGHRNWSTSPRRIKVG